jgi:outer membrane receptor for ferrienterochelin and colicin
MFPVEVIDRIEYVHGPGSVLYGTNAYEGVINVITKKSEKDMETEISVGAGSFGANIGKGTVNLKKNDLSLLANINYLKDDGWDYNAVTADSTGVEVSGKTKFGNSNTSGSLFLTYKDFTFECYIANLKQGNLGIIPFWPATGQNGAAWLTTSRRFADIGYSKQLGDYNMQANVTYNYYVFECYCNNSLLSSEGAHDILGEVSIGGSVVENVNFIAGAVLTNQKNDNPTGAKIVDFDRNYYAGYLQFDYKPVDKLKLVGGAQYNKPEDIDAVTVPRIGGVYQFSDKLTAKASYSGAFRSPWPIESLTYFPGTLVGDPLLKPEKVKTVDCQVLYNTDKHHTGLTFFRSNYEDVITRITHPTIITTPKPTSSYDNSGEMEIQGFEIESKVSIKSGLYVEGSGTYQTEKNGKVLTPYFMAKAGVSYHAGFGLIASIFDNYFGEPRKNAGKVVNPEAKEVHLVSVNLDYTVPTMKSLSFNVFVQNALDQDYYYPEFSKSWVNTLPLEPGRAVYGTASYKF